MNKIFNKGLLGILSIFLLSFALVYFFAIRDASAATDILSVELKPQSAADWTVLGQETLVRTKPGETLGVRVTAVPDTVWNATAVRISTNFGPSTVCISGGAHDLTENDGEFTLEFTIPKSLLAPAGGERHLYVQTFAASNCSAWSSGLATVYELAISQDHIAQDDIFSDVVLETEYVGDVLANDYVNASLDDVEITTATLVDGVSNGSLDFVGDGTFEYTPNEDFVGEDSFTYTVPFKGFGAGTATSNVATVTLIVSDGDGVDSEEEAAGPNDGDANGDDIPDILQNYVSSFVNPVTGTYAVLENEVVETSGQATTCLNSEVTVSAESANEVADGNFSYPAGLMNLSLDCGDAGATVKITMYFFGDLKASDLVARKYHTGSKTYIAIPGATITDVEIGGLKAVKLTYEVTDGGPLDMDGAANGTIVDPAGVAAAVAGAPNTGLGGLSLR